MPCARSVFDIDDDHPTEIEMQTALQESRQIVPARASHTEVQQLHKDIVDDNLDDNLDVFAELFEGVTCILCVRQPSCICQASGSPG